MTIQNLQNDSDYVILSNPFASPKFVKAISKTESKEITTKDIYSRKLFYEIVSRLKPGHLENIKINESIFFDIEILSFAKAIGASNSNNFYSDIKNTAEYLANIRIPFKTKDGKITTVGIISKTKTDERGKITLFIDSEMAEKMLEIDQKGNFSFLKEYIFKLQNGQGIKLYPFFKSWLNSGRYETDLERFKEQFGYNTVGYKLFSKFKEKVLEPATKEINDKTDIIITYQTTGDNLDGLRPRVNGLIFYIKSKEKIKELPSKQEGQEPKQATAPSQEIRTQKPIINKSQTTSDIPSEAQIFELGEKLKLTTAQVQTIIGELKGDHIRTFEVLQGCINESKTKTINSNFAYIIGSLGTLGVGLYQQEKTKAEKRELERIAKEKQTAIEKIQNEYQVRKKTQFLTLYNTSTDKQKAEFIEYIKKNHTIDTIAGKKNYLINKDNQLNDGGIIKIGEILAEQKGLGKEARQGVFRNETFEKYGYQIGFDENDQAIILGLFEDIEPSKTAARQTPEAIESPTAPSQKYTPEQLAENKKRALQGKRKPKPVEPTREETQETPTPPAYIQEPTTEQPKTFFQKIFDFTKPKP